MFDFVFIIWSWFSVYCFQPISEMSKLQIKVAIYGRAARTTASEIAHSNSSIAASSVDYLAAFGSRASCMASFNSSRAAVFDREERRQHLRGHVLGLNAYERHKRFMTDYARFYGEGKDQASRELPIKTDFDTLRETYRFIRSEEDDSEGSWEQRLAKRYYDKLFREYCIADMSRYRESKIGLRWRGEKEVVAGKGQFVCGNRKCSATKDLHSYEVNFAYKEAGEHKQALVKLRVCPKCAYRLNYRKEKERKKQLRKHKGATVKRSKKRVDNPRSKEKCSDATTTSSGEETESGSGEEDEEEEEKVVHSKSSKGTSTKAGEFDEYFDGMFL